MSNKVNDWANGITMVRAYGPTVALASGAFSVTGINCVNYDGPMGAFANIGTVAGTETTFNLRIQEAITSTGTYTDLTTIPVTVTSTTGVPGMFAVNFYRNLPWLRVAGTVAGTTATLSIDILFAAMKKQAP